jgi:N-hydroxyarylamine O-acetyltransferase
MNADAVLDLEAYRARVGYAGAWQPTIETLIDLHLAHTTSITFENLDILLGRPIYIDLATVQNKLVASRRGGYCFEQNTLFAEVLKTIGFRVTILSARVRFRSHRVLPRTHILLLVEAEESPWIADVGFGTVGLLQPIPLRADDEFQQFGWSYRLVADNHDSSVAQTATGEIPLWTLQAKQGNVWESLYSFSMEPQYPADLEMANWYVSTNPDSRFVQTLTAQRSTEDVRYLLRNFVYTEDRANEQTTRELKDWDEVLVVLADKFDLHFPPGTRFRIPSLETPIAE